MSMDPATKAQIANIGVQIANLAAELENSKQKEYAMQKAALILIEAMQRRVAVHDKPVKRYIGGRVVAIYYPGNLKRSIQVLKHMKDKASIYAGVLKNPKSGTRGVFSGSRVDGFYAHMVEYGPRKRPFVRPAVAEVGAQALAEVARFIRMALKRKQGGRN